MLHHWRKLSSWSPTGWALPLAVFEAGTVVGTQTIKATNFAITREVSTGSWLGVAHQSRGIGTEMRAAVLTFAFHHLGAATARSGAFADNLASAGVSAKLGYHDDGVRRQVVRGELRLCRFYRLNADDFTDPIQITVDGLVGCLPQFAAEPAPSDLSGL